MSRYDSHRPQSVKRDIVKCLHDRAKRIITKPSRTAQEKKHLSTVLVANDYPPFFLQKVTKTRNPTPERETAEFKSTAVLPYIKGVSEPLHRHLQQQGIRTVFKSDTTIRSRLVRPKDPADPNKEDSVVCTIPFTCGKVYIGETGRPMQEWKDTTGIYDSHALKIPRFQSMWTEPDTSRYGTKQSLAKLINVNDFLKSIINFGVWYLFRAINSRATFFMIAVEPLKGF